ncbi:decarboxylase [archaeon]|jgi:ornithine decarboxylase|nr:decarboxylase [archaeon]MBT4373787.1 decarboxylase [archaeon]MBT4532253.1 decarboxylase [archaeon]MBT7001078.1 decarboxylase [archaeon]MBT7281967.1 decarboxylase [archaeon]
MTAPKFILSKSKLLEQYNKLKELGLKVSYSYKTNHEVGKVLQELEGAEDCEFSIHAFEEIEDIKDKSKISFFTQAENKEELKLLLEKGIRNFVVDNEIDLRRLLKVVESFGEKINLSLRMKFQEHRIGTGKYFVYGMSAGKVNELLNKIKANPLIEKLGVHIHRKSQNVSEWLILDELKDSLGEEILRRIDFVNLGGGLPVKYRSYTGKADDYIFEKIREVVDWSNKKNIQTIIEPGRFLAAPAIQLETEIIQIQEKNLIINTTIYNCAVDNVLTGTKMLVEGELDEVEEGNYYLIKGNSPTRDDIFRYRVKLKNPKVGDKIIFLNAGAYNYTTDFFGYKKLKTEIKE